MDSPERHPIEGLKYQPNVAAIVRNSAGLIFVGERLKNLGAWQFPQGGIDPGESPEVAMRRELWEEIGVESEDYRLLEKRGPYYYGFPSGVTKRGHQGKQQWYFLCDFVGADERINIATAHPEFSAWRWVRPEEFRVEWLPVMKREVYRQVFVDFFGIEWPFPTERN